MLENIKSLYFIRILFSKVTDKIKLKVIKYNKAIQKIIGINKINYKLFSGKYTIYETNKTGKIYNADNNKLLYDGEILNGEKNGKGKEFYSNGKLKFEGEYLKGKKWNGNGYYR